MITNLVQKNMSSFKIYCIIIYLMRLVIKNLKILIKDINNLHYNICCFYLKNIHIY
ncbi:hypothetical protein Spiro2_001391 [Spirobacillus cienkowskii]